MLSEIRTEGMSDKFWCENCSEWVQSGEVNETLEEIDERGDTGSVYEHDLCGSRVTPADEY